MNVESKIISTLYSSQWCTVLHDHVNYILPLILGYKRLLCETVKWVQVFMKRNKTNRRIPLVWLGDDATYYVLSKDTLSKTAKD